VALCQESFLPLLDHSLPVLRAREELLHVAGKLETETIAVGVHTATRMLKRFAREAETASTARIPTQVSSKLRDRFIVIIIIRLAICFLAYNPGTPKKGRTPRWQFAIDVGRRSIRGGR
jgi:hypothetical protein